MRATAPPEGVTVRAARPEDVARMTQLIAEAQLPPLFIEEFLDGFVAAERDGEVIACGGVEVYGPGAVVRSVVVDEHAQGLGLGRLLSERLIDQGRAAGARDFYLFTVDAWPFWQHLGFADVTLDAWIEEPRACWQYQFISQNPGTIPGMRSMWMHSDG